MPRYTKQDRFHRKAKQDHFAARSVYKLEELDRRFRVVRKGDKIVDLGSAPGSWLQYLSQAVGKKGIVVGYDIAAISINPGLNVRAFETPVEALNPDRVRQDLSDWTAERKGVPAPSPVPPSFGADVLLSDMAPKLTGIRDADQVRQIALADHALGLAIRVLKPNGRFVAKLFQGRETDDFLLRCKRAFRIVRLIKPEATREGSREVFVVAENPTGSGADGHSNETVA
ncbi:MAG: SAM-dependent methyltransferase [Myxococcota bacterium]